MTRQPSHKSAEHGAELGVRTDQKVNMEDGEEEHVQNVCMPGQFEYIKGRGLSQEAREGM